ncbi:MAG TPA: rhomboid family intramembrane serine protease [Terriglobia bacterium]
MIPLRDDAPRSTTPYVTYFLIALNVLIFLYQLSLPPRPEARFEMSFGFVPYRVDSWLVGSTPGIAAFLPAFTSMFLHAGWLHLIGNMWFLYLFGDNVEDRLGHFRYLISYLISGLAASFTHYVFNMHSKIPTVGASGAIAGVLGAYFLLFPTARVLTWFFVFVVQLPAWLVLGWWFVLQFLSGAATSMTYSGQANPVAVWAHVGGFIAGMLLVKIMPARKTYYAFEEY